MPIRPRHLTLPLLLALSLGCLSVQAQQANGLQQRMSDAEFKAAGLDKLSAQELQNLDDWLSKHGKTTTKMVDTSGQPVFYEPKQKRSKFNARLVGHFSGWHGHDEFTLDNGQSWKQIGSDAPDCMSADNPAVKVKPSLFDSWLMYVDGCNGSVHVRRTR
ncbi:hypothetical protein [Rhodanobacter thiooxydans]|uniref:hypothetical protein n=1 Tax=Rhodanobacter thiooxydans TaxID=416169 RepID=UPI000D3C7CC0|nr:hypothetical protein [Rhodanobacter thiooxydans]